MALSYITREADGVQSQFDFPFGYLSKSHVFMFVDNSLVAFKWISDFLVEPLVRPLAGSSVTIRRLTDRANRVTTYTDGQTLLASSLNAGDLQTFFIAQEMIDQIEEGIVTGDVSVINPGTGYITAQWIQDQLQAGLAGAPQFDAVQDALDAEAIARANAIAAEALSRAAAITAETNARIAAVTAEASARAAAVTAEAAARAAQVLALTAADADQVDRLVVIEQDLNTPTTGVKAKLVFVEDLVTTETSARASADAALQAELDNPTTGLKARATSLESRTTAVETGKASAAALDALEAVVEDPTTGLATRASQTSVSNLTTTVAGKADASRVTTLETAVNHPTTGLSTRASQTDVTNLTTTVAGKADASRVTALETSVNNPTTGLSTRASQSDLSSLTTTVAGKADASRVTTLETSVNNPTTGLATRASQTDLTNLTTTVAGKADASRVTTLETSVNHATTGLATRASQTDLTNLTTTVSGKADASRVTTLETSVNNPTTGLATRASQTDLTNLTTTVAGKADASRVTALETSVNSPTTGLATRASQTALNTLSVDVGTRATAASVTALQAELDAVELEMDDFDFSDVAHHWEWAARNIDGWTLNLGTTTYPTTNGGGGVEITAPATPAAPDVTLVSPVISVLGSRYTKVLVDIECVNPGTGMINDGRLYWLNGTTPTYTGSKSDSPRVAPPIVAGQRRLLIYDLDQAEFGAADWLAGTTTRIRFDLPQAANSVYRVYSISIVGTTPAVSGRIRSTLARAAVVAEANARVTADNSQVTSINNLQASFAGRSTLNGNPFFDEGPASSGAIPPRWAGWSNGTQAAVEAKPFGGVGLHARMLSIGSSGSIGWQQSLLEGAIRQNTRYVLRGEISRISGTLERSGVAVQFLNTAGTIVSTVSINFGTEADTAGIISNSADGRRKYEKVVTAPATATRCIIYAFGQWTGFGTALVTTPDLRWFECSISTVEAAVAGVTDIRSALATGNSSRARLALGVNTATNEATIEAIAMSGDGVWNGSKINLSADIIGLLARSINFGTRTTFEDTRGTLYNVEAGKRLRILGPFGASNDLVLWYGNNSTALQSETKLNGNFALATDGKVYYGSAELGTGGGAPSRAKGGSGAVSVTANNVWENLAIVGYGDIPNPSTFGGFTIGIAGQSQSGAVGAGTGWEWRIIHAPASNFSDAVVLKSGTFTVSAGENLGGGAYGAPTVETISSISAGDVAAARFGAVNVVLQVRRGGGTSTIGLTGTLNVTSILP